MRFVKLTELRKEKGIKKMEDMANRLGISKPFYCQIETRKRRLSYEMACRIARVLDTTPDEIFYEQVKAELDK